MVRSGTTTPATSSQRRCVSGRGPSLSTSSTSSPSGQATRRTKIKRTQSAAALSELSTLPCMRRRMVSLTAVALGLPMYWISGLSGDGNSESGFVAKISNAPVMFEFAKKKREYASSCNVQNRGPKGPRSIEEVHAVGLASSVIQVCGSPTLCTFCTLHSSCSRDGDG